MRRVVAFTDTYLPTVNGVTYTVKGWRDRWRARGGRMDVVYPRHGDHDPGPGEFPVPSLPFPCYPGFRVAPAALPDAVNGADVVHAHTPFGLGLAARRLARRASAPLVASYHTPTAEYATYLTGWEPARRRISAAASRYERRFLSAADAVVAPTRTVRRELRGRLDGDPPIRVVTNGVDTDRFRPVGTEGFRDRYGLGDGSLVGYTGRHGHEKNLHEALAAVDGFDRAVGVVFGGDGPARRKLEAAADDRGLDARFLGFLPRAELPAFYSALDAFLLPSTVETQGRAALEAIACGTPVVSADAAALTETVRTGETGYRYPPGDVDAFRAAIRRTLDEEAALRGSCLARRGEVCLAHAVDDLRAVYRSVA
jgi:glycosyltransferase involved in cell wall biosynthesis